MTKLLRICGQRLTTVVSATSHTRVEYHLLWLDAFEYLDSKVWCQALHVDGADKQEEENKVVHELVCLGRLQTSEHRHDENATCICQRRPIVTR